MFQVGVLKVSKDAESVILQVSFLEVRRDAKTTLCCKQASVLEVTKDAETMLCCR
jgi:hypothetical protein